MHTPEQIFLFSTSFLLIIIAPLISNRVPSQGLFLVQVCGLAIILFWATQSFRQDKLKLRKTPLDKALFALFISGLLSLFFTQYKYYGLRRLTELFFYLLIYFSAVNLLTSQKRLKTFLWMLCAGCLAVGIVGLAQYFDLAFVGWEVQPWGEIFGRRIFSTLGNPNWLASYLLLCLPLAMGLFLLSSSRKTRLFSALLLAISFFNLLLTKSLAGWLGFVISFLFFLTLLKHSGLLAYYQRKITLIILALAVLLVIFAVKERPAIEQGREHFYQRLLRYQASLEIIKDYPLLGVGLGNLPLYADSYVAKFIQLPRYKPLWPKEQSLIPLVRDRAENEYLDIASETGILGFAAFIWLIIAVFMGHRQRIEQLRDKSSKVLLLSIYSALLAILVDCLFGFPLHVVPVTLLFFILLAVMSSLEREEFYRSLILAEKTKVIFAGTVSFLALVFFFVLGKQFVAEVYLAKGIRLKNLQRFDQFVSRCLQAKKWDIQNPKIDFELGMGWRALENYDAVISSLERYLAQRPYDVLALYNLGFAHYKERNHELAIKEYKKALELKPMFSYLWQQLGQVYLEKGENQLAAQTFSIALDYDPGNVAASIGLTQTKEKRGEVKETTEDREIKMHFRRAQGYIDKGELDLAAGEYKKILKLTPQNSDALSNLGVIYLWKGMDRRAESNFRRALEINPQNVMAKKNLEAALSQSRTMESSDVMDKPFLDVPILMYHKINDKAHTDYWVLTEEFAKQMQALAKYGYRTLTLKDLYNYRFKNIPLPDKPVVITFDDGFENFYTRASPILKAHKFTATIFLIAGQIGKTGRFGEELAYEPDCRFMDEIQLKELSRLGFSFGCHSFSHPKLPKLEAGQLEKETLGAKKFLEERLGLKIEFFSYPYGEFNAEVEEKLSQAGYLGSVFAKGGIEEISFADFYALRRVFVRGGQKKPDTVFDFLKKVDPTCSVPEIKVISLEAFNSLSSQPQSEFKPGEAVLLKVKAQNLGDAADVSLALRLKIKKGKEEKIIYTSGKASQKTRKSVNRESQPVKKISFEATEAFEFSFALPPEIGQGEALADLSFQDPHFLLDYFSLKDIPVFTVSQTKS